MMRDALCVEYPDVEFFVERGQHAEPAKAICRRCLVRAECLDYAITHGIAHGIWGGQSASGAQRQRDPELETERPESWAARRREIVTRVTELRQAGLSYGRIASRLQAAGYHTKTGGAWNGNAVRGIFLRENAPDLAAASMKAVA